MYGASVGECCETNMLGDFDHILLAGECSACGKEVLAPYRQLQITGVFGCICGAMTRSNIEDPRSRSLFDKPESFTG